MSQLLGTGNNVSIRCCRCFFTRACMCGCNDTWVDVLWLPIYMRKYVWAFLFKVVCMYSLPILACIVHRSPRAVPKLIQSFAADPVPRIQTAMSGLLSRARVILSSRVRQDSGGQ